MPDPIKVLLEKAQRDLSSLTLQELESLRKFLDTQSRMREARRSKFEKAEDQTPPIAGRRRRVSSRYLAHLADVAALFLECDRQVETTARRAREDLGLPLNANTLRGWRDRSPEFRAALEDAEVIAANAAKAKPEVRAPRDIAWLQQKQAQLQELHDEGEITDAERKNLRREIRDFMEAIRREERHIADLRDRRAKRDFARFLERLVEYVKVNHARKADVIVPVFRAALRSLDTIIRGAA